MQPELPDASKGRSLEVSDCPYGGQCVGDAEGLGALYRSSSGQFLARSTRAIDAVASPVPRDAVAGSMGLASFRFVFSFRSLLVRGNETTPALRPGSLRRELQKSVATGCRSCQRAGGSYPSRGRNEYRSFRERFIFRLTSGAGGSVTSS